jgi:pimeloyl-ACP methyl ester carboxylesterase
MPHLRRSTILLLQAIVILSFFRPSAPFAQESFLPSIADTLSPSDWLYIGPFSVGAREGIVGVFDDPENPRPREGDRLPSILPQGGRVSWKKVAPDSTGWVTLEYQNVWWDTLMTYYGVAGIVDAGYAYAEFQSQGQARALAVAQRVGSFYLNGKRFSGDVYGHGYVKTPVLLQDGINRVLVELSGYGDHRFLFKLIPPPAPVILITADATLPDLIGGQSQSLWAGITVLNTTEARLNDVKLSLGGDGGFEKTETVIASIMPLCVKKVPVRLKLSEAPDDVDTVSVPVEVSWRGSSVRDRLQLRVRNPEQSRKVTFISAIDNSCQYYALLPPKEYDSKKQYGLILALHGAAVEASRLIDCHAPKDWTFVVAPTNRRPYGFDWQDWGRLDALEVLKLVEEDFPIDTNRVYLTGHSMGGHGTWHIALAHPDLFAAAAPMAGWTCFQLYVPWFLQKSYSLAEPRQIAVRDMSLREDFVPEFVENALNLPIFITQGGSDDNVPPVHARMFASLLEQLGYDYEYNEIPGKRHWYSLDDSSHTVCVDDPRVMDFLKDKIRNPFPKHVIFKTNDIGQNNKSYWVEITQQEKPYFESRIQAEVKTRRIDVQTTNVREFVLSLSEDLLPYGKTSLNVNGQETAYTFEEDRDVFLRLKGDVFVIGKTKHSSLTKTPLAYGPIKQAYFSPFVLVYGTKDDSLAIETTLHQARLEAARWWSRANGSVDIFPDTEVTEGIMENYNLILFGGPEENFITGRLNQHLPIRMENGRMLLGENEIPGDNLAAEFIYPNPLHPDRFVFIHQGIGAAGLELSNFFTTLYAGAGLPDFVVFDRQVKRKGWGGVICAGFFGQEWQLDDKLYYLKE